MPVIMMAMEVKIFYAHLGANVILHFSKRDIRLHASFEAAIRYHERCSIVLARMDQALPDITRCISTRSFWTLRHTKIKYRIYIASIC